MNVRLMPRARQLLGIALFKYDRLCQGTSANLTTLNLPNHQVEGARGNIKDINERLGSTDQEVDLPLDLVATIKDALKFALTKYQKAENDQTELLIPTVQTEATMNEVRALQRLFGEQIDAMPDEGAIRPNPEGISELKEAVTAGVE